MTFVIPEGLGQFSIAGLKDLLRQAQAEYDPLRAAAAPDTVTDEELERLEQLQTFIRVSVPNEFSLREERADRFAALDAEPEPEPETEAAEETTETEAEEEESTEEEPDAVAASMKTKTKLRVAQIGGNGTQMVPVTPRPRYSTLVAAAGVPGYEGGQRLDNVDDPMLEIAKAFIARSVGHGALQKKGYKSEFPVMSPVAQLVRDYPEEFSVDGDERDYNKLLAVSNESRLPGGSLLRSVELRQKEIAQEHPERDALVAAQGWCAPSETDYDICLQITTDGLYDAPEVQARRGGIRHNSGIEFDTIFGGGNCASPSGFFDLTEAEVASGTVKTCLEIPCPSFTDDRLGVTGLCLTGNILAIRGYPEFTATFTRGALAASAHQINREQIAEVVAGSTAVNLTAAAPWATDTSVVSQVLSACEMAIVDIKYRLRLLRSATLEVVMPYWILAQMRADWIRRNGGDYANTIALADSAIAAAYATRGARVQYVYDWQDAFTTCAVSGSPGADTPITQLPTSLSFLVYPAGTWIRALNDVITLNSVYDSTKLATNQVTHLFTETGWKMIKMCPVSRVYTVGICPNGKTGLQRDVTC